MSRDMVFSFIRNVQPMYSGPVVEDPRLPIQILRVTCHRWVEQSPSDLRGQPIMHW